MRTHSNPIEELIIKEGNDDSAVFVFPSDIAATLWLETALALTGRDTLPVRRFIAWDRFKEQAVQATVAQRQPVSSVLRKLYALELAERNRTGAVPFFSSLIPADFAEDGSIFASWIARILPQLEMWERRTTRERTYKRDIEDDDLSFLKADYNKFLEANLLFEPSWQRPPLADTGNRYFIFFPEAIEDFGEYEAILEGVPFIKTVSVQDSENGETPELHFYENTREELRAVALEIETLLGSGTKCEDIAVSVPGLENVSPYLLREFSLRGIPFEYRAGEPLGTRPAGRLFSLIQNCVSSNFSFASVKALLLDRLIPWKQRNLAEELVSFGIRNHCVTSWKENGTLVDIWEEAFKTPSKWEAGDRDLRPWYRDLKNVLNKMTGAETFTDIRTRYIIFREKYLDSSLYSIEDDAVVARCVSELNTLASLEKKYSAYIPSSAFSFFTSVLDEKNYVAQRIHGGISIYPYRVAAGTPYSHHFILDASQAQTTILYRRLPFLAQDKRSFLDIGEIDASRAFFAIYGITRHPRFSFSSRSFSGYQTPHGYFRTQLKTQVLRQDPFMEERLFLCNKAGTVPVAKFPESLYNVQKNGRSKWKSRDVERGFSYLDSAYANRIPTLVKLVKKIQMNESDLRISQSDLGTFSLCNASWFLGKILRIEAAASDAELMNERNIGLLYHDILEKTYKKIRTTDNIFSASRLGEYCKWAAAFTETAASEHAEFRGPLAAPLIASLAGKISEGVCLILEADAKLLDGFIPEFLEGDIAFSRDGIRYYGRIDRISRRPSDNVTVLIDYKSGKPPSSSKYIPDGEKLIGDFQIPMYVFLAEESPESPYKDKPIEHAWFGNIKDGDYQPVINDNETIKCGSKRGMVTRDEFEPAMESFKLMTSFFESSIQKCDFTRPINLPWTQCTKCDFQKICRYTYTVRP